MFRAVLDHCLSVIRARLGTADSFGRCSCLTCDCSTCLCPIAFAESASLDSCSAANTQRSPVSLSNDFAEAEMTSGFLNPLQL